MNKRKILTLALSLCMIAILAVGGTLAYFTADDKITNVFTAGSVELKLDEAKVEQKLNGNYDKLGSGERTEVDQKYDLHPGIKVDKDPTIYVTTEGELKAYVAAKITVSGADLDGVNMIADASSYIDIHQLIKGGEAGKASARIDNWQGLNLVYESESAIVYQDASSAANAGKDEWFIYVFFKAPVEGSGNKLVLFETLEIPATYDNDQMAKLDGLNIDIKAFATQTDTFMHLGKDGLGSDGISCLAAMKAAFPNDFKL